MELIFNTRLMLIATAMSFVSTQFLNNKPWPNYSLENMPRTGFSCRDKILGGYYADAETRCQMFHVCVKVAGVGVQDFRFLCPNGTAFDQEAQTCVDWGDVDCEQATLYYGSDNFDLYRIGSGFESKRAPFADEEEATFHLQRAETGDARRSKLTIVNQNAGPDKISLYNGQSQRQLTTVLQSKPPQSSQPKPVSVPQQSSTVKPATILNNYSPAQDFAKKVVTEKSSTTTTSTANNQFYSTQNKDDYKEDDIFKGSHSSNFFNGRNGKDDDYDEVKPERSSTSRTNVLRTRQRGRVNYRNNGASVNQISDSKSTTASSSSVPRGNTYTPTSSSAVPVFQQQGNHQNAQNAKQQYSNANAAGRFGGTAKQSSNFGSSQSETLKLQTTTPVSLAVTNNNFKVTGQYHAAPVNQKTYNDNNGISAQQSTVRTIVQSSTPEKPKPLRQDPFKVTKTHQFNNQQDQFNYHLNNAFHPTRTPTSTVGASTAAPAIQKVNAPTPFSQSNGVTNKPNNNSQFVNQQFNSNNGQFQGNPLNKNQFADNNNQFNNNNNHNNNNRQFTSNNNQPQQQFNGNNQFNVAASSTADPQLEVRSQNVDHTFQRNANQNTFQHTISGQYQVPRTIETSKDIVKTTISQAEQNARSFQQNSNDFRTPQNGKKQFEAAQITPNQYSISNNYSRPQSSQIANTNHESIRNNNNNKETRTLLSSFSFEPSPTTYNPHSHQQQHQSQRTNQRPTEAPFISSSPRGFSVTPPKQNTTTPSAINSRYQTVSRSSENYTPSTVKRFSTLVPRDMYNPTTFKPSANVKPVDGFAPRIEQQNKFVAAAPPVTPIIISTSTVVPSTTSTTTTTTTAVPLFGINLPADDDEDDGQYRPELYEQDFAKNKLKNKNKQQNSNYNHNINSFTNHNNNHQNANQQQHRQTSPPPLSVPQTFSSGEDEFLHTAHSQNIAASKNELHRAAAAAAVAQQLQQHQKTNKQQAFSQKSISKAPTIPPNATSTKRPIAADKDASYDYAYYDSVNDSPHDYTEYGITDFGRTSAKKN